MTAIINASTSSGIVQTADTSGTLALQSNGTTQFTVSSTGAYGQLKSATAQASTSGTSIDFTSIPSWVKRITVMFHNVSTSGTSQPYLQLGDSGGVEDTGYVSGVGSISTAASTTSGSITVTAAFPLYTGSTTAASTINGNVILSNLSGNIWTASASLLSGSRTTVMGGSKELSATLTQVRLTTAGGTDTFDAGSINILYEG
jgi:hypothetical protein